MTGDSAPEKDPDGLQEAVQIDAICDRFEAALLKGERPDLRAELEQAEPGWRADLFRELLGIQLSILVKPGEEPGLPTLLAQFPEYTDEIVRAVSGQSDSVMTVSSEMPEGGAARGVGELLKEIQPGDRYRLEGEVARGGMGTIHLAEEGALRRRVAVKRMLGSNISPDDLARFIEEAQITGQLDHPGIVPVYELGVDAEGAPFYSMKFVHGRDLHAVLLGLRKADAAMIEEFPLHRLLTVFDRVCDAMAFAHAHGVIHRDLKPANIRIGEFGEVLVMDWGLAKLIGQTDRTEHGSSEDTRTVRSIREEEDTGEFLTLAGSVMGSPQYMAPEQAMGATEEIDQRTDIFALGAVLYQVITRQPRFPHGTVQEMLKRVITVEDCDFPDETPEELQAICRRALKHDPEERFQTVGEMQTALRDFSLHRESVEIADGAARIAANAEAAGVEVESQYGLYAEAVSRFGQALELWEGNKAAQNGLEKTLVNYAELALEHGDFNLVESQLNRLENQEDRESLRSRLEKARQSAMRRRRALARTRAGLGIAAIAIVGIVTTALFLIRQERDQTAENLRASLRSQVISNYAGRNYQGTLAAARELAAAGGDPTSEPDLRDAIRRSAWLSPLRAEFPGLVESPRALLESPDSDQLFLIGEREIVRFDRGTEEIRGRIPLPAPIESSPVVSVDDEGRLWILLDQELLSIGPQENALEIFEPWETSQFEDIVALAVAPEGRAAAALDSIGTLSLVDLGTGEIAFDDIQSTDLKSPDQKTDGESEALLVWSRSGDRLAAVFPNRSDELHVFGKVNGEWSRQAIWRNDTGLPFFRAGFAPDGEIVALTRGGRLFVSQPDARSDEASLMISRHGARTLPADRLAVAAFRPEQKVVATLDAENRLLVESFTSGKGFRVVQRIDEPDWIGLCVDEDRNIYALSGNGDLLLYDGEAFGLRRLADGIYLREFASERGRMHVPVAADIEPDSFWYRGWWGNLPESFQRIEIGPGEPRFYGGAFSRRGAGFAIHPEGSYLATASENQVRIYPARALPNQRPRQFDSRGVETEMTRFSPSGRWLAAGGGLSKGWGFFEVAEAHHWYPHFPDTESTVNALEFVAGESEGAEWIAILSEYHDLGLFDPAARDWIWRSASLAPAETLIPHGEPGHFWVVQGDGELALFDGQHRREIARQHRWKGWIEPGTQIAHSPRSEFVAMVNRAGELQICDRRTMTPLFDPGLIGQLDPEAEVRYLTFNGDGSRLMLFGGDRAYALETARWEADGGRPDLLAEFLGNTDDYFVSTAETAAAVERTVEQIERYFSETTPDADLRARILAGVEKDWTLAIETADRIRNQSPEQLSFALELASLGNRLSKGRSSKALTALAAINEAMGEMTAAENWRSQARRMALTKTQRDQSLDPIERKDITGRGDTFPPVEVPSDSPVEAERWPPLPEGEWVDLMPYIDPTADTGSSAGWRKEVDGWLTESSWTELMLPVQVDGSYEVEVLFRRDREPLDPAGMELRFSAGDVAVTCYTDAISSGSFSRMGGRGLSDWGSFSEINDELPHRLKVEVAETGNDVRLDAQMDGVSFVSWEGASSELANPVNHLGMSRWGGIMWRVTKIPAGFQLLGARIRLNQGKGHLIQPGQPPMSSFHGNPTPLPPDLGEAVSWDDIETDSLPVGRWIDLTPEIHRIAEANGWAERDPGWSPPAGGWKVLNLPTKIDGGFELLLQVSRTTDPPKKGKFEVRSNVGNGFRFSWDGDMFGGGLSQVDGEPPKPGVTMFVHRDIRDGEVHSFRLRYAKDGDRIRISSRVDEETSFEWEGDAGSLKLPKALDPGQDGELQLVFSDRTEYTLHRVHLKLLDGGGSRTIE